MKRILALWLATRTVGLDGWRCFYTPQRGDQVTWAITAPRRAHDDPH